MDIQYKVNKTFERSYSATKA